MYVNLLKSKIHHARVTEANLHYVGSITIDSAIMKAIDLNVNEKVLVVNLNNGERIETYTIAGEENSGVFCLNGACARKFQVGDTIIIMSFCWLLNNSLDNYQPKIAILDEQNKIINIVNRESNVPAEVD